MTPAPAAVRGGRCCCRPWRSLLPPSVAPVATAVCGHRCRRRTWLRLLAPCVAFAAGVSRGFAAAMRAPDAAAVRGFRCCRRASLTLLPPRVAPAAATALGCRGCCCVWLPLLPRPPLHANPPHAPAPHAVGPKSAHWRHSTFPAGPSPTLQAVLLPDKDALTEDGTPLCAANVTCASITVDASELQTAQATAQRALEAAGFGERLPHLRRLEGSTCPTAAAEDWQLHARCSHRFADVPESHHWTGTTVSTRSKCRRA